MTVSSQVNPSLPFNLSFCFSVWNVLVKKAVRIFFMEACDSRWACWLLKELVCTEKVNSFCILFEPPIAFISERNFSCLYSLDRQREGASQVRYSWRIGILLMFRILRRFFSYSYKSLQSVSLHSYMRALGSRHWAKLSTAGLFKLSLL